MVKKSPETSEEILAVSLHQHTEYYNKMNEWQSEAERLMSCMTMIGVSRDIWGSGGWVDFKIGCLLTIQPNRNLMEL